MKKPAHLKLKENNTVKRNKTVSGDFEQRKEKYKELKELRQKLKQIKQEKIEAVCRKFIQVKHERKRLAEKKKLKEINDLKSGQYQVVSITNLDQKSGKDKEMES